MRPTPADLVNALAALPVARAIVTAKYDVRRAGALVRYVAQCADEPPLVCVAIEKGRAVSPLIRDSRAFALNMIDGTARLLIHKFAADDSGDDDPFLCLEVGVLRTGSPVLRQARAVVDCEVIRHFDLEADHEVYVGRAVAGSVPGLGPWPRR